jgi:cytosine permease
MEDEFQTSPVPDEACIPWPQIAMMNAVFSLSIPTLLSGLELANAAPGWTFVGGTLAGGALLSVIASFTGVIGSRTRLSSYMLAQIAFGARGSLLLNLGFGLSLLGWFGVNIELFSDAATKLLQQVGFASPDWLIKLGAGLLMSAATFLGLKAINRLALLVTPVLGVVVVLMLLKMTESGSIASILERGPGTQLDLGGVLSAIVGAVVVGAVIMPDTCRFIKGWQGAVGVSIIAYLIACTAVTIVGGIAGIATGQRDVLALMLALGLGFGAFAIVFGGSWTLNALNLYSATLSVGAAAPRFPRQLVVLLCGAGGTLFAFLHILDFFIPFLLYLAIIFVPVGGIIIVDFFLLRQAAYLGDGYLKQSNWQWRALVSWAAGTSIAALAMEGVFTLTNAAAIDAIVTAAIVHALLGLARQDPSKDAPP